MEQLSQATTASPAALSALVKELARAEGFDKVGIVSAAPLEAERGRLEEWLRRGYQRGGGWMGGDTARRTDPRLVFPPARSVVVCALNYFTPHTHADNAATGKISRYA